MAKCEKCGREFSDQEEKAGWKVCEHCESKEEEYKRLMAEGMSDAEARATVWPTTPEDFIRPETNMSERRDIAMSLFTKYLRDSVVLRKELKQDGKYNLVYECPDIGKKWVMTVEEVDL